MKLTATKPQTYNGFAIPLQPDTPLGLAMLIAENEEGHYEPVCVAATISEGRELAQQDLCLRMQRLEEDEDPGICPYCYKLWARGVDGTQLVAATWNVSEL